MAATAANKRTHLMATIMPRVIAPICAVLVTLSEGRFNRSRAMIDLVFQLGVGGSEFPPDWAEIWRERVDSVDQVFMEDAHLASQIVTLALYLLP